ncbi:trp operon leader peptide [Enterobacter cancerogenus]|uniref:trp operon leader peptide n=1 Tax=Enterobacter cancerogenus TaxID=69218 RepID=A0ABX8KVP8_9ENTR|nr:trp operon leader peptide [Enterobacter cancerogenus]
MTAHFALHGWWRAS